MHAMLLLIAVLIGGCAAPKPDLTWTKADVAPGIVASRALIEVEGEELQAVVMVPETAGAIPSRSMPGVVVLAGGSDMLGGSRWDEVALSDAAELAREGVAVMAIDTPGAITPSMSFDDLVNAMRRHILMDGGASIMPNVLTAFTSEVPAVDPNQLYIAGIGSSAAAAKAASYVDDRIRGVILYEPGRTNPISESTLALIEVQVTGARAYLQKRATQGSAVPLLELNAKEAGSVMSETRSQVARWISMPK
jgi:hypothetical protein